MTGASDREQRARGGDDKSRSSEVVAKKKGGRASKGRNEGAAL